MREYNVYIEGIVVEKGMILNGDFLLDYIENNEGDIFLNIDVSVGVVFFESE